MDPIMSFQPICPTRKLSGLPCPPSSLRARVSNMRLPAIRRPTSNWNRSSSRRLQLRSRARRSRCSSSRRPKKLPRRNRPSRVFSAGRERSHVGDQMQITKIRRASQSYFYFFCIRLWTVVLTFAVLPTKSMCSSPHRLRISERVSSRSAQAYSQKEDARP